MLIVLLPPNEFLHSSPEAPRTTQARETSASEGRELLPRNLASRSGVYESTRFFYMPQSWDMGQNLSLPLRRKACWGSFRTPEKSNGFCRVRTRELGVPVASMLTTRPPKPLVNKLLEDKLGGGENNVRYSWMQTNDVELDLNMGKKEIWRIRALDGIEGAYVLREAKGN